MLPHQSDPAVLEKNPASSHTAGLAAGISGYAGFMASDPARWQMAGDCYGLDSKSSDAELMQ